MMCVPGPVFEGEGEEGSREPLTDSCTEADEHPATNHNTGTTSSFYNEGKVGVGRLDD